MSIIGAYTQFAAVQQQKLLIGSFVMERQTEIDDPIRTARTVLLERYAHIDPGKLEDVLKLAADWMERSRSGTGDADPKLRIPAEEFKTLLAECDALVPGGYAFTFIVELVKQKLDAVRPSGNADNLRASLFTGLIADFEAFLVSYMSTLYRRDPAKLSKERTVTWSEILATQDLDALREELLDRAVVDIMRGSFSDWMVALKRDHNIDMTKYTAAPQIGEMFQRRHVIIHNGGRVSRLYMQNVPMTEANLHEHLPVSQEYFEESADRIAVVALALTVAALLQLKELPGETVEQRMTDWVYELLLRRRYNVVNNYLSDAPLERLTDLSSAEICKINRWLALKRLGRFDECRTDVEAWQVGHLGRRFHLAKMALVGDVPGAWRLAGELLKAGELPLVHWVDWPLLEEVRVYESGQAVESEDFTSAALDERTAAGEVESGDA